ncbi:unnamed protein product [Musa textilis]
MAEIALLVAEELDGRRNWKEGDHGGARQDKRYSSHAMSPSTVSALGRRAQDEATAAAFLRIGPKEVALRGGACSRRAHRLDCLLLRLLLFLQMGSSLLDLALLPFELTFVSLAGLVV